MSPLAEFLSARIAEDEAAVLHMDCQCSEEAPVSAPGCPDRVLAECASKRRIVENVPVSLDEVREDAALYQRDYDMRALASVYADHPDYDPDWA